MRFAISIPQVVADGTFDPARLRDFLVRAEALGFESAWTQEQILGTNPQVSPLELMSYAAACTERIRLGCAVLVTPLYSPVHLAKSLSSLDQLSRGRLEIGVGSGGRRPFAAYAVDPDTVIARFTEGIRLMKELWTRPRTTFDGRFWQLDNAPMEPKPAQKPYPPLWFGGSHPNALRRAVRHGTGFFGAGSTTTARFAEQVEVVREALAEQGRAVADFPIAKRIYIGVGDDIDETRQRMSDGLNRIYGEMGRGDLLPVTVYGPPEVCVEGVREVFGAGAELVLFTPLFDEREQLERLAGEVLPKL